MRNNECKVKQGNKLLAAAADISLKMLNCGNKQKLYIKILFDISCQFYSQPLFSFLFNKRINRFI